MRNARKSATASKNLTNTCAEPSLPLRSSRGAKEGRSISALLKKAEIERLDAELLLAHVLRKGGEDRSWLLAHAEEVLTEKQCKVFLELVARRRHHEPLAYILGEKEFYGRKFFVNRRVMIPRPSTETLIEEVKNLSKSLRGAAKDVPFIDKWNTSRITSADNNIVIFTHLFPHKQLSIVNCQLSIVDVGTGSGCIGITLALELPELRVICTDISEGTLEVARKNARRHNVFNRLAFLKADLLSFDLPTRKLANHQTIRPFLVISNPPYIPEETPLPPDIALFEPLKALFAGPEGMDVLKPLYEQCRKNPLCVGCVFECQQEQAAVLCETNTSPGGAQ